MKILNIVFILLVVSCGQQNESKKNAIELTQNPQTKADSIETERLKKRKQIEEEDKLDSIRLEKVLKIAIDSAYRRIVQDNFKTEFIIKCDTAFDVNVEINLGYHFTNKHPHLFIRRVSPYAVLIDIYSKTDSTFINVLSHEQWTLTYVNDTIRDINGDKINDFVVNWYGASGCCLKGFSNVYLLRTDKMSFSENFEFINPTFSPKEKLIRGICYGHPGETEMYKYKWHGEKIDTVEYVSYEKDSTNKNTGKIIISNNEPYSANYKILRKLRKIPSEYTKIEEFDWFTGNLNGNR
ncbi:MAG: hypothetical protein V4565_05410 [Bacteroidota bacterium]